MKASPLHTIKFMKKLVMPLMLSSVLFAEDNIKLIKVDQIGYLRSMPKWAILSDPIEGRHAKDSYTPSVKIDLVDAKTSTVVGSFKPTPWNNGAIDAMSKDKVWHLDFSRFTKKGTYFLRDTKQKVQSHPFVIDSGEAFKATLRQAMRVLYDQRCGIEKNGFFKDEACHIYEGQDTECTDFHHQLPSRDLSGGWHDAGDYNKYIGYAYPAVQRLLSTYLIHPKFWNAFKLEIPENKNDMPDILDEAKWELDWMLKMQVHQPSDPKLDGGVLYLVANDAMGSNYWIKYKNRPASEDKGTRRFLSVRGQSTCAAFSLYAYGAYVYAKAGQKEFANTLKGAALKAWTWIKNNPEALDSHYPDIKQLASSNGHLYGKHQMALLEGYLFMNLVTQKSSFAKLANTIYLEATRNHKKALDGTISAPLVNYTLARGSDSKLKALILEDFRSIWIDNENYIMNPTDAYFNLNYGAWWGSNGSLCRYASYQSFTDVLKPSQTDQASKLMVGALGYLHGRNPLDLMYLTNMGDLGGERYLNTFYHGDILIKDNPGPANLVGGPNSSFSNAKSFIANEPPFKAFDPLMKEQPSYEYFEGQVALQASYINLLTALLKRAGALD
jgi:hypothetical protein